MKLIVGLGNPGSEYAKTRHNAGFMVVDRLCAAFGAGAPVRARFQAATIEVSIGSERCLLMKPTTFMNLSGRSLTEAVRFYKADPASDLLVVVDDLYLPTGTIRLKPGGGAAGHNGLASIQQLLGNDAYPRLRVGVGRQPDGGKPPQMDQADFVLSRFSVEEEPLLDDSLAKAAKASELFVTRGLSHAMNVANAGPQRPGRPEPPEGGKSPSGRPSLN